MVYIEIEVLQRGASQSNETSYYFLGKLCLRCLTKFYRGGSRAAATSKMERFVIIVNGWKSLTIITKHSILDIAAALDSPLIYLDIISAIFD